MSSLASKNYDYTIEAGKMTVSVEVESTLKEPAALFDIASRQNPKRGFLIVSKCIGRNFPTRPKVMRATMEMLASIIPESPGPVLFIGMAETAVILGQGVHAAWMDKTGREAIFLSTTRQLVDGLEPFLTFEELHSHASSHVVFYPSDANIRAQLEDVRTVIIVDDEASTGATFNALTSKLRERLPRLDHVYELAITDWSGQNNPDRLSLMHGTLDWAPSDVWAEHVKNGPTLVGAWGRAQLGASCAREGYIKLQREIGELPLLSGYKNILVLADGENGYDALRIAEAYEKMGHSCSIQSITRSPAMLGGAVQSRHEFDDSHGSGAPCFIYNLFASRPEAIVCVAEILGTQLSRLKNAVTAENKEIPCIVVTVPT